MNKKDNAQIIAQEIIQNRIYTIRNVQVMLDNDLAELYGVEIRILNQAVKRNTERFPKDFMFQLSADEWKFLRSQFVTLKIKNDNLKLKDKRGRHRKYLPYAFTEQGVAMLSAVLRSDTAVKISIQIMQAFIKMRRFIIENVAVFQRLDKIEQKQLEADDKFDQLFDALESKSLKPRQGIFYDGQVFDAYTLIADIIRSAKKSILLIDNYVDDTTLKLFTKRKKGVKTVIYTNTISKTLQQDLSKHNSQYEQIEIKQLKKTHDRFLIVDQQTVYHIGASLKDLGKKWFAFSKLEMDAKELIDKL